MENPPEAVRITHQASSISGECFFACDPTTVRKDRIPTFAKMPAGRGIGQLELDQPAGKGHGDRRSPVDGVQLSRSLHEVEFHRTLGNLEDDRDFPRCLSAGDPAQYLALAGGQHTALLPLRPSK